MIRVLIWLAVLGVVVYIAYNYAEPHLRAWRFRGAMNEAVRLSGTQPDQELHGSVLEAARDLEVPLRPNRLTIRRDRDGRLHLSASWDEVVELRFWRLEWLDTLQYVHEAEGARRTTSP